MIRYTLFLLLGVVFFSCQKEESPDYQYDDTTPCNLQSALIGWEIDAFDLPNLPRLLAVNFPTPSTGYIVGLTGGILKTSDSGASWEILNSSTLDDYITRLNLWTVHFVDKNNGYIGGAADAMDFTNGAEVGAIFLKTNDGGLSWAKTYYPAVKRITNLHFFTANEGFAIFNFNEEGLQLGYTSNGGEHWEYTPLPFYTTKFVQREGRLFLGGSGTAIWYTDDQGAQWNSIEVPVERYDNFWFANKQVGYIVYDGLHTLKTVNSGASWQSVPGPTPRASIGHFASAQEGFSINQEYYPDEPMWDVIVPKGSIFHQTFDGGQTWWEPISRINCFTGRPISVFPTPNIGYVISGVQLYIFKKKE